MHQKQAALKSAQAVLTVGKRQLGALKAQRGGAEAPSLYEQLAGLL